VLFDLQSPGRRRVIRVVYAVLAGIMFIGFVGFGIGTAGNGPLSDLFGGGGSSDASSAFDDDITTAQQQIQANPKTEKGYLDLANAYLGKSRSQGDEQNGFLIPNSDSGESAAKAIDAWTKYLALKPAHPNGTVAGQIATAYLLEKGIVLAPDGSGRLAIAFGSPTLFDAQDAAKLGAEAQQIAAQAQPSTNSYGTLALFENYAGDFGAATQAQNQALAKAQSSEKQSLTQQFKLYSQLGHQLSQLVAKAQEQQKKQQAAGGQAPGGAAAPGLNSFGGLGGGSGL
jgi:hypothetical protein